MLVFNGKEVFSTLEELVAPKHTALLLIDLQNDYLMPGGYHDKLKWDNSACRQIVSPVKRVLEAARHSDVLVVHIQMTLYPGYLADSPASLRSHLLKMGLKGSVSIEKLPIRCIDGTWGWQRIDELTPLPNEVVVKKHRSSAFIGTDLDMILRSNGIKSAVITGLVTQGCVMATALDALLFDYYPILLQDCIASPSSELHDAAFLVMSHKMDTAVSEDVFKIWSSKHFINR